MPFPPEIKRTALLQTRRSCCLCRRFAGRNVELHHIQAESEGGANTLGNAVVLCFECHADVGHYDPSHPRGNKYSPDEVKKSRDLWVEWCAKNPMDPIQGSPITVRPLVFDLLGGKWRKTITIDIHNTTDATLYDIWIRLAFDQRTAVPSQLERQPSPVVDVVMSKLGVRYNGDAWGLWGTELDGSCSAYLMLSRLEPHKTRSIVFKGRPALLGGATELTGKIAVVAWSEDPCGLMESDTELAFRMTLPFSGQIHSLLFESV